MKEYVLKNKLTCEIIGRYSTVVEASDAVKNVIGGIVFHYAVEEVEAEPNNAITDYESANRYLRYVGGFSYKRERYTKATNALNKLLTIAEAWNKMDGFVPDFNDDYQIKWTPIFVSCKDGMELSAECRFTSTQQECVPLHFKTRERAMQFGKQFIDLWKNFLMNK